MERFHGNGLKNLNSAVILNITTPKKKFGARGWHKESFLKFGAQSDQKSIFKIKQNLGKKFLNALYHWRAVTCCMSVLIKSVPVRRRRSHLTCTVTRVSHIMPALNLALNADFEKKH